MIDFKSIISTVFSTLFPIIKIILIFGAVFIIYRLRLVLLNLPKLIYYKFLDAKNSKNKPFPHYGVKFYTGRQGSGKTMSMCYELEQLRKEYPNLKIYTNFGYEHQTQPLLYLHQLMNNKLYNGLDGTVFAIDEIQNEFAASTNINSVPVDVLSTVTQLRKQRIYILCTTQVFTRVAKPLREQASIVCDCKTYFGRLTDVRSYDGFDYADSVDKSIEYKSKNRVCLEHKVFVQSDQLRNCYDSYALINKLYRG